jgi:hypothetical protein
VALLEKRRYLNNHSGDFPQVILIVPSHVPNSPQYENIAMEDLKANALFQKSIKKIMRIYNKTLKTSREVTDYFIYK